MVEGEAADTGGGHRAETIALVLTLAPFFVGAVALTFKVGSDYRPVTDWALTEMHVRGVGGREAMVGLYSRPSWSHPGPLLFYLLAPFYWLSGGSSIGLLLGALAINAGSVAGMGFLARRHGGTPLLLCTLLACALVIRTLGAGFVADPWVCFVTTLPFALLIYLVWSLASGNLWALPAAAFVATFLTQTHVGFVLLAGPLAGVGAGWLVLTVLRSGDKADRWRLLRSGAASAGLLVLLWLPPLLDILSQRPSNARRIVRYFRHTKDAPHTWREGWNVVISQFGLPPEWLTQREPVPMIISGNSPCVVRCALFAGSGTAGVSGWGGVRGERCG